MKKIIYGCAALALVVGCQSVKDAGDDLQDEFGKESINKGYMDVTVMPQDDFFLFANGTWVKKNPVPPSESHWGSFNELEQDNMKKLTSILEEAKANPGKDANAALLGNYYASFMDMNIRNERGITPIQPLLDRVWKLKDYNQIPVLIADLHQLGIGALFNFGVSQDMKNVDAHIVSLGQGGLSLPNRDYYFDEGKDEIRAAFIEYVVGMAELSGLEGEEASVTARAVLKFETKMAQVMLSPSEMRNPENNYHMMSFNDAAGLFRNFEFSQYVKSTGLGEFDSINIAQPDFASYVGSNFTDIDLDTWKRYLYWKVLNHYANHLSGDFVTLSFQFYGGVLSGKTEMKPMNERAIQEITRNEIGEVLGKAFVEQYYSLEAQDRVNELVDNLLIVFQERINELEWMSGETKTQALKKLNAIGRKLGFPETWTDFSSLELNAKDYIGNINACASYGFQKNIAKFGQPVDKSEWGMPAHMVNAYYHPLLNEIAFPAGIMQPPFFSPNYEDAVNYGRIGMVIGHEFTHGFDDNGSLFDASGNFSNWWTEADRGLFEERTALLGNTFNAFCPMDGVCVNGSLTMGENIADLGGLTLAYHAYTRTAEFKSAIERYGYTPAQRFFIAYAQLWKINYTDAELKKRIATDPHSPGMYRVNGPLMNCPEFFEAFGIKEGDPMRNSEENVSKIW